MSEFTYLWHDYESFGADPRRDRPCQFAAIRTDAEFNVLGEPEVFYAAPADDFLPHPMAVLVTRITPQEAKREGVPESEFAGRIHALMSQPNTCVLGYNSLRFDDEMSRHLFYRNFLDPYSREWQNGNSRWDLIDLVRTFYALRPEGINWPKREDGSPSFRLEDLTAANGIEHAGAHDALVDVRATIELAKLLRSAQPRLFDYLFNMRGKHQVAAALNLEQPRPVLHISGQFPASQGCAALVLPVAKHPTNPNAVIVFDLSQAPAELLALSAAEIQQRVFVTNAELTAQGLARIPLKLVHLNRCPVILPLNSLEPALAERHGINLAANENHWRLLSQGLTEAQVQKIQQVFQGETGFNDAGDPDLMLYSGAFFSNQDKQVFAQIRATAPEELSQLDFTFQDARGEEMLFRYLARNWPEFLTSSQRERWDEYRWQKFNNAQQGSLTLKGLEQELRRLGEQELSQDEIFLLQELQLWVESNLPLDLMY